MLEWNRRREGSVVCRSTYTCIVPERCTGLAALAAGRLTSRRAVKSGVWRSWQAFAVRVSTQGQQLVLNLSSPVRRRQTGHLLAFWNQDVAFQVNAALPLSNAVWNHFRTAGGMSR